MGKKVIISNKYLQINKMKIKSMFTAFNLKAIIFFTSITIGFSSLSVCRAQSSVVGKWKVVSVKQFYSPEYVKKMGKTVVEGQAPANSTYQWEFKSDHTYIIRGGRGKDDKTTGGICVRYCPSIIEQTSEITESR